MCGRYALTTPPEVLAALLHLQRMEYDLVPRYNIAPTQMVAVVRADAERRRELVPMRWGLIPFWAKDRTIGARMINARSESAALKPAFRQAMRRRRCLIPASGFYEWKKLGKRKQPYYIRRTDDAPLGFAGLWESWSDPQGGETLESCTILTTDSNGLLRQVHDRMPVILDPDGYDLWLDPDEEDPQRVRRLLAAAPSEVFSVYPVHTRVNSPGNDDASLIEPLPAQDTQERGSQGSGLPT